MVKRLMAPFNALQQHKEKFDSFRSGDSIKATISYTQSPKKIITGICIAKTAKTITLRHTSNSESLNVYISTLAPVTIEKVRSGRVRRSKLYYLYDKSGKAAKIKEKRIR